MNYEGPILSLQPGGVSHSLTAHPGLDLSRPPCSVPPCSVSSQISSPINYNSIDMSSSGRNQLGINSKVRSSSIADCKSVPNSPPLKQLLTNKVNGCLVRWPVLHWSYLLQEFRGSSRTLSPTVYPHTAPRVFRASSAEPDAVPNLSHSLTISSSPKIPLASRIRRQPTIDTSSFTREEFEVCLVYFTEVRTRFLVHVGTYLATCWGVVM